MSGSGPFVGGGSQDDDLRHPILIAEQVVEGLGHLLAIYAIARAAGGS